jgi:hypothetical protein
LVPKTEMKITERQGCHTFLGTTQSLNIPKWSQTIQNGYKIYEIATKYNIFFNFKSLKNKQKLGFLV